MDGSVLDHLILRIMDYLVIHIMSHSINFNCMDTTLICDPSGSSILLID
jgi:hypothetical protein